MLPADARLHTAAEFSRVTRRGQRGAAPSLVTYRFATGGQGRARAGFVVSKKVGNAVIRNRVTRRLRPLMRDRLQALPVGTDVVVRALPRAATADSRSLGADLDTALRRAERKGRSPR